MRLAATLLGACVAVTAAAQDRVLYPRARFQYAYPKHAVRVETCEGDWIEQQVLPKRSVRELHTWPVPVPTSGIETFAGGKHVVLQTAGKYVANAVHFWDIVAVVSPEHDYAFKIEGSHHRTAVWGIVHAWKHLEWGGDGAAIPADFPVWAMYESIYAGVESGTGVWSRTHAFRISHLRVDGAGEEFVGDISDYLGVGEDAVGRQGLRFRRRTVNFSVDVSVRGGRPIVSWSRGGLRGAWREDPVHTTTHLAEWRESVDELHADPPPPKARESEFFCLIGSRKRGMQPAKVASILEFKGWSKRRAKGRRPQHIFAGKRRIAFQPRLRPLTGFVREKGGTFQFMCKELGLSEQLEVPEDLRPLLAAWVKNFPR